MAPLEALERGWLEAVLPNPRADFREEDATAPDGAAIRDWEHYVLYALNPRVRSSARPSKTEDLTRIEGYILRRRLGLDGDRGSLARIGEEVLLARERVRQLETLAVGKVWRRAERDELVGTDVSRRRP